MVILWLSENGNRRLARPIGMHADLVALEGRTNDRCIPSHAFLQVDKITVGYDRPCVHPGVEANARPISEKAAVPDAAAESSVDPCPNSPGKLAMFKERTVAFICIKTDAAVIRCLKADV